MNDRIEELERSNAQLDHDNHILRCRVYELEQALLGDDDHLFAADVLHLTPSEHRILRVLLNRPLATRDTLAIALYDDMSKDRPEPKIYDVFLFRLRKKLLHAVGVDIETIWGRGWRMTDETKTAVRAMLTSPDAARAAARETADAREQMRALHGLSR